MRLRHGQAVWLMVAVTLMWSIAGVVTRQLEHARSFEVTFWRSFFTAVSLLVLLPLWQGPGIFRRMHWKSGYFWLSGICWSVMFTAFMVALSLTTVANVLVTLALGPLFTAILARIFVDDSMPARTWGAIFVAGLGIAWMYGSQVSLGAPGVVLGYLVALCVPIAGAIQWTVVKRSQGRGEKLDMVPCVLVGAVISSLVTLPLAFPFGASATDVSWLALLGVVQLAIPCVLSVICARVLQAPEVSLLGLLEIVFGIALAWLGANEAPDRNVLIGGALVIGALVTNEIIGWRRRL
ncbi:MAG: DMT family transporter [Ramlibacter sp.]|nr:DMT family transporter [Ramlibacter sp.]